MEVVVWIELSLVDPFMVVVEEVLEEEVGEVLEEEGKGKEDVRPVASQCLTNMTLARLSVSLNGGLTCGCFDGV